MSYSPGDWVELVQDVEGVAVGQRGKVTSTGFFGGLDIELSTGARLVGVDPLAVKAAPASADTGCAVTGLAGLASIAAVVAVAWSRARWGA
jgi:hypothetical protein